MYCVNCGKEIADGVTFCPYCGASVDATPVREYDPYVEDVLATGEPVQEEAAVAGVETTVPAIEQQTVEVKPAPVQETVSEQPTAKAANGFAIAGFVCSFFVPILGIIFGSIGMAKSKKMNGSGLGLAIAALSISISFIVINMLTCGSAFAELFENIFYFKSITIIHTIIKMQNAKCIMQNCGRMGSQGTQFLVRVQGGSPCSSSPK